MRDEDDCFSPYKCARLFPSENEWPWSLSEENVEISSEVSHFTDLDGNIGGLRDGNTFRIPSLRSPDCRSFIICFVCKMRILMSGRGH
jgi:hypothetical protein